jgi:CDP-diacylglycerol--glycerol-3-phosphate 3-phosphatidyltransferase
MINLPNALSLFRIAMVPVLLGLALSGRVGIFLTALALSLASDVADGFAARRLGQCTPLGTRLDSWGDLLTYAVLLPCVILLWPQQIRAEAFFVAIALTAFVLPTAYGYLRFGRLTSYHTYGAKLSALMIGPGVLVLLGLGEPALFRLATCVLVLSALEEMAITAQLDAWQCNIPGLWHLRAARRSATPGI